MYTKRIKGELNYIFDTVDEFVQHFSPDVPELWDDWRTAPVGAWVKSDDGRICQIIHRGKLRDGEYIRTILGAYNCNSPSEFLDTDPLQHSNRFSFGRNRWIGDYATRSEKRWIFFMMNGADPIVAYKMAYPKAKSENYIYKRVHDLLTSRRIKMAMKREAKEAADKLGVSAEYVINGFKKLHEKAKHEKYKLDALKELAKIADVYPDEPKQKGWTPIDGGGIIDANEIEDVNQELLDAPNVPSLNPAKGVNDA